MAKSKFISLGLVLIMIFSLLTSCSTNKYNAVLYSNANEWIDETFLKIIELKHIISTKIIYTAKAIRVISIFMIPHRHRQGYSL